MPDAPPDDEPPLDGTYPPPEPDDAPPAPVTVLVFPAGGSGPPVAGGALVAGGSGLDELLPLPPLDAITTMSRISKARPPNATALRRRKMASCLTCTPFKRADRSTRSCGATLAPPWPDSSTPPSPTGFR